MQVRPLEAVLALFVIGAAGLSLRDAATTKVRQSRIEPAAAALEALVSARVSETRGSAYRHTSTGNDRYRAIEGGFLALGARYLHGGHIPEAIAVFEMTIQAVPRSWSAWNGLGAAYESAGDWKRAAAAYAQSVALNPNNEDGRLALKRLQGS